MQTIIQSLWDNIFRKIRIKNADSSSHLQNKIQLDTTLTDPYKGIKAFIGQRQGRWSNCTKWNTFTHSEDYKYRVPILHQSTIIIRSDQQFTTKTDSPFSSSESKSCSLLEVQFSSFPSFKEPIYRQLYGPFTRPIRHHSHKFLIVYRWDSKDEGFCKRSSKRKSITKANQSKPVPYYYRKKDWTLEIKESSSMCGSGIISFLQILNKIIPTTLLLSRHIPLLFRKFRSHGMFYFRIFLRSIQLKMPERNLWSDDRYKVRRTYQIFPFCIS